MLEKSGQTFWAECDFCSNTLDTDEDEFHAAVAAMKRAGWLVFRKLSEWFHKCDACQTEENQDDFEDVE